MRKDIGRVAASGETGSRPTGQAPSGLDASRFDPARFRELADRLRFRMEADGLSLRDAAPQIGVSFSTLGRVLRGHGATPRTRKRLERWLSGQPNARAIRGDFDEYDWQLLEWLRACKPEREHTSGSDFSQGVIRGFEIVIAQIEYRHHRKYIRLPRDNGSDRNGEDAPSAASGGASQSGRCEDSGIAQPSPGAPS